VVDGPSHFLPPFRARAPRVRDMKVDFADDHYLDSL
jgi:hypothetical protein